MIIHKCDRCGAEIISTPKKIFYPSSDYGIEQEELELCDRCYNSFKDWMNGPDNLIPEFENHWCEITTRRNGTEADSHGDS